MQQFAACQRRADAQAAARTFQTVDFSLGNRDRLVHIQMRIQNHHRTHQFGNRSNRHDTIRVFLIQHFTGFIIENQSRLRRKQRTGQSGLSFDLVGMTQRKSFHRVILHWEILLQKLSQYIHIIGNGRRGSKSQCHTCPYHS